MEWFWTLLWIALAVAAGLVLGVVALVAIVLFIVRRRMRRLLETLKELEPVPGGLEVPPMRIDVERWEDFDEWIDADAVMEKVEAFEELGFERIGEFEIVEIDTSMVALHQPEKRAFGVVYEQPELGVWIDIGSDYEDGRHFTASTGRPDLLERPPGNTLINAPELRVPELYERFLRERPSEGMRPVPVEGFTRHFEQEWMKEMTWRGARGGPSAEEIRAVAERDGDEATPEVIEQIRQSWQSEYAEFLSEALREQLLRGGMLSAAEWDDIEDQLLFVHEWSPIRELAEEIVDAEDEADEDVGDDFWEARIAKINRMVEEFAVDSRRESFQRLNAQLPEDVRLEKIRKLKEPVPADVYLTPGD